MELHAIDGSSQKAFVWDEWLKNHREMIGNMARYNESKLKSYMEIKKKINGKYGDANEIGFWQKNRFSYMNEKYFSISIMKRLSVYLSNLDQRSTAGTLTSQAFCFHPKATEGLWKSWICNKIKGPPGIPFLALPPLIYECF